MSVRSSSLSSSAAQSRMMPVQLRKNLEILDSIPMIDLPSALLTPPSSRGPSPTPSASLKRKLDPSDTDTDTANKRPRPSPSAAASSLPSPPKTSSSHGSPSALLFPDLEPIQPLTSLNPDLWQQKSTDYATGATKLRRSAEARSRNNTEQDQVLSFLENLDAMAGYCYAFWLLDILHAHRNSSARPGYAGNAWATMPMTILAADDRWRAAMRQPDRDNRRQRIMTIRAVYARLDAFAHALAVRALTEATNRALTALTAADGSSPSVSSPPAPSPPDAAPVPNQLEAQLDLLRKTIEYNSRSTSKLAQAAEDGLLRPEALAQTFPRTARRLLDPRGVFRPQLSNTGVREQLALDIDAASGPSPSELANTVLEWPTAPLSQIGAGMGALAMLLRSMVWELGADNGYKFLDGAIEVVKKPARPST